MEVGRVAGDLLAPSQQQRWRARDDLRVVARLHPAGRAFEADRARAQRQPPVVAQDELDAVGVAGVQLAVHRLILHRCGGIGLVGPLTQVHAVGAPFEAPASGHAAAFFEMEGVHQLAGVRAPSGRAEVHVPIHLLARRLGLGRQPTTHRGPQATGMGMEGLKLTELAALGQFGGVGKIGQAAALRAGLEHAAGAAEDVPQRQALGDVLRARLFAVYVFAGSGRHRGRRCVPVRPGRDQHGVDVVAGEQLAHIDVRGTVLVAIPVVHHGLGALPVVAADIADGDAVQIGFPQEAAQHVPATIADSNGAQHDSFARGHTAILA